MVVVLLLISLILAFALFELLAYRYGVDTRPGFDERLVRGRRRNL
jgi:hypothetical protein